MILIVILSCLIWVFAEQAVTQELTINEVEITLVTPQELLAEFLDQEKNPTGEQSRKVSMIVEGPAVHIQLAKEGQLNKSIQFDLRSLAVDLQDTNSKDFQVKVLEYLDKRRLYLKNEESYLQVTESKPATIPVRLTRLVLKPLVVKVYDQNNAELIPESVECKNNKFYVFEGHPPEIKVILDYNQQLQAAKSVITVVGSVQLPKGSEKCEVLVKLADKGGFQPVVNINKPRIGILLSGKIQGEYKVIIEESSPFDLDDPIKCRGDHDAIRKYEEQAVHLVLEIKESDIKELKGSRELIYYYPELGGKIEIIDRKQALVNFRLKKIPEEPSTN